MNIRPGHCVPQAFFDGRYNTLDGDMATMILLRDNHTLANERDLIHDHDLIKRVHQYGIMSPMDPVKNNEDQKSGESDYVEAPRPLIYSTPVTRAPVRQPYTYQVQATHSLGDLARRDAARPKPGTRFWRIEPLEFSLTQKPSWMSIDRDTGLITGTSDGTGGDGDF